jgi:hypothetical protein
MPDEARLRRAQMGNMDRDIGTDDLKIEPFVEKLRTDKFLIPTFQRDFVWEPENVIKLWDSIFRFYPIGSILYWETDSYLHTHRKLGGFTFPHDEDTVRKFKEWSYILDGQQRATSLLVSMLGGKGKVKDDEDFNYTLYFDATDATFFFASELEKRKKKVNPAFLIRLRDVPKWKFTFYKEISTEEGFNPSIETNLQQLSRIFTDYKISLIRIKGVGVNEVCEIFERINQEGKRLDPVDIIVARTYRNEDKEKGQKGFYLRDNLRGLKQVLIAQGNRFQHIDDLAVIQMVAICLRKLETGKRRSFGITPAALDNLTTEVLEANWNSTQKTALETIKLLWDMKIHGPDMLPYTYLAFPITYHLHNNKSANRSVVKQWFWRTAFGVEDFRRADEVYQYCTDFFDQIQKKEKPEIQPLVISKTRLVQTSYHYRNALSRAVLAFLANQKPLDFSDPDAEVLDNVYLLLSQAPNLHHIYPRDFLDDVGDLPKDAPIDSLMNICFLRAKTNIQIGKKNPLHYFREFATKNPKRFDEIIGSHLIPREFIEKPKFVVDDYAHFLKVRADMFAQKLRVALPDVDVKIVD